ncbi:MAG: DUF4307 domain-containing protein [Ruaniaceae bacterium]|nr:DUF4307 domain-containing protein [Ruaniaceae bacterium]
MTELTDAEYLQARYGARQSDRRLAWILGGIATVIVIAWFVWQVIALDAPTLVSEEVALDTRSDTSVAVTFNLTTEIGSTVSCTVRAYTENMTEVGVKEVTVGPVSEESSSITVEVATIQPANGARVTDCRFVTQ